MLGRVEGWFDQTYGSHGALKGFREMRRQVLYGHHDCSRKQGDWEDGKETSDVRVSHVGRLGGCKVGLG